MTASISPSNSVTSKVHECGKKTQFVQPKSKVFQTLPRKCTNIKPYILDMKLSFHSFFIVRPNPVHYNVTIEIGCGIHFLSNGQVQLNTSLCHMFPNNRLTVVLHSHFGPFCKYEHSRQLSTAGHGAVSLNTHSLSRFCLVRARKTRSHQDLSSSKQTSLWDVVYTITSYYCAHGELP